MKVVLKDVILSFPTLYTPKGFAGDPNSKPSYSASFLFDANSAPHKAVQAAMEQAAAEKWTKAGEAAKTLAQLQKQGKTCLRDGSEKSFDGYEGRFYVAARSPVQPLLVHRDPFARDDDGQIITQNGSPVPNRVTEDAGLLYGGAVVNATIDVYAQDSQYGKRINAVLRGIQWVRHGDAFGKVAPRADEFETLDSNGAV